MSTPTFASNIKYTITQYTIDADIQSNGGVDVTEYLSYKFNNTANGIFRDIDFINPANTLYSAQKIDGIAVYEAGLSDDDLTEYTLGVGSNGSNGIFSVIKNPKGIRIKIYAHAKEEEKRFVIQYHLTNAVVKYRDCADFYWQFIGSTWENNLNKVSIVVTIPQAANSLRIFSHGPLSGNSKIVDSQTVQYTNNRVRAGTSVSLRMLFPTSIINNIANTSKFLNVDKLSSILKSENDLAIKANQDRKNTAASIILAIIWPLLCILLFIFLYNRYGKTKKTFTGLMKDPPGNYGPAFTEYILNYNTVGPNGITAEIMNLFKKGYLSLEEDTPLMDSKNKKSDYRIILSKNRPSYDYPHEEFLVNWFFNDIGDGITVTFEEIKKYSRKNSNLFNHSLREFKRIIKTEAEALGFKKNSTPAYKITLGFLIFSTICGLILVTTSQMYAFLISGIFNSLVLFFMSFVIKSSTPELAFEKEKWLSYKRYLKALSLKKSSSYRKPLSSRKGISSKKSLIIKQITPEHNLSFWEDALLYTIIFGYSKGAIKQIKLGYPTEAYNDPALTFLHNGGIDSFSSCITSSLTNFSSTTGFGSGGSSSGGTGGGGGRGGAF